MSDDTDADELVAENVHFETCLTREGRIVHIPDGEISIPFVVQILTPAEAVLLRYLDAWHNEHELGEPAFDREVCTVPELVRFLARKLAEIPK